MEAGLQAAQAKASDNSVLQQAMQEASENHNKQVSTNAVHSNSRVS